MYPYQALTSKDKKQITAFINRYGGCTISEEHLPHTLDFWNRSKGTLFKGLGNKLIVTKQVSMDNKNYKRELDDFMLNRYKDIYRVPSAYDYAGISYGNKFINEFMRHWRTIKFLDADSKYFTLHLLSHQYLHTSKSTNMDINFNKIVGDTTKPHTIKSGTKIMRAIRTLLVKTNFKYMDEFNNWRAAISVLQSQPVEKVNIKLSIHPIDFMSMSTNDNNWSSCMSWDGGCYSNGTLEMMNSNMVMVGYIESDRPMIVQDEEISNKQWRCLIYATNKIIVCGRAYPYRNDFFSSALHDFAVECLSKNLKWKYKYRKQRYYDAASLCNNHKMRNRIFNFDLNKHKNGNSRQSIFIYTNGMYNDILASSENLDEMICSRNPVKKNLFLNASGKCSCVICGKDMDAHQNYNYYDDDFRGHGKMKICSECREKFFCQKCGQINTTIDHHQVEVVDSTRTSDKIFFRTKSLCDDCLNDYVYLTAIQYLVHKGADYHNVVKYIFDNAEKIGLDISISTIREYWDIDTWKSNGMPVAGRSNFIWQKPFHN